MKLRNLALALLVLLPLSAPGSAQDRRGGRRAPRDPAAMWERMKRFDTDGDGTVTREEFRGPAQVFTRMDRDGDGVVTEEEVRASSAEARGDRPGASLEWVFRRLDRDGSEGLDGADLERILEEADEDGDKELSKDEFLTFLQAKASAPRRGEAPAPGAVAPDFRLPTVDGKSEVALSELVGKGRPVVLAFGSFT